MITNVCQALWIVRAIFVGLDSEDLESLAEYARQDTEIDEESANWLVGMIGVELQARNTRNNQSPRFSAFPITAPAPATEETRQDNRINRVFYFLSCKSCYPVLNFFAVANF